MQKLKVALSDSVPGMIVAEPVRNIQNGAIYISEHQELTEDIIHQLQHLDFKYITIYVNSWNMVWNIPEETFKTYDNCTESLIPVMQKISLGESIALDDFKSIKDNILGAFADNYKIIGCVNLVNFPDQYNYTHSINVALISMLIGKWMKYGKNKVESLLLAGLLHDIGKMKVDPSILNKPEKLSFNEFELIKKHPLYAYDLLQDMKDISLDVKIGVLMHHERIDGSGYPYGVYGDHINDLAKVIAIADVYDAMISERPYKKKYSPFKVMQLMQEGTFGELDVQILFTFLSYIAHYYIGVYVLLNTGEVGQVIAIQPTCIYRPIIKVKDKYINLFTEKGIDIIEVT